MLHSSLGFHTITLSLSLLEDEAEKLVMDFGAYGENTGLVQMYRKQGKDYITYHPTHDHLYYLPSDIKIYYSDGNYRGIKWKIYFSDCSYGYPIYIVKATINPKILSRTIDYITAATYSDINIALINFNEESKKVSPLLKSFTDYKITRIDYCINICLDDFVPECTPEQMINLIKRGDIPPHYKEWAEYDNSSHRYKSKPESFYLVSKSATINCYSKYMQLQNASQKNMEKGYAPVPLSTLDAARNIIRFEVQCKYFKTYFLSQETEKTGNHNYNKYESLLSPLNCIKIVSDYYKKVIGRGDWYSLQEAVSIIKSKHFNCPKEKRLVNALLLVNQYRSIFRAKSIYQGDELKAFKLTLNEISSLGINPVTIPKAWNIKHIPNLLRAYFDRTITKCIHSGTLLEWEFCAYKGYTEYVKLFGHPPI